MTSEAASTEAPPAQDQGSEAGGRAAGRTVLLLAMRNALPVGFVLLIALFVGLGAPNFLTISELQ